LITRMFRLQNSCCTFNTYSSIMVAQRRPCAAQRRVSPATGPARLTPIKSVLDGAEPLKNRAVGCRVQTLVGPPLRIGIATYFVTYFPHRIFFTVFCSREKFSKKRLPPLPVGACATSPTLIVFSTGRLKNFIIKNLSPSNE